MNVLPVRQAANLRPRPEAPVVSWVIALFSLPTAYSEPAVPPPASATTPRSPASCAPPPEPASVEHPCARATRLLPLTQPRRASVDFAGAAAGAAANPSRRSDTSAAVRYALATSTCPLNQIEAGPVAGTSRRRSIGCVRAAAASGSSPCRAASGRRASRARRGGGSPSEAGPEGGGGGRGR